MRFGLQTGKVTKPDIADIVELIRELPEQHLQAGMRVAVGRCPSDAVYELEFTDAQGETLASIAVDPELFIPAWRAATEEQVSPTEQMAALLACLPDETACQVLDSARFLSLRVSGASARQDDSPARCCNTATG
jgi:hypothetical protein